MNGKMILLALMSFTLFLAGCAQLGAAENESDICPEPAPETALLKNDDLGYCLLYPDSYVVEQLDSGNTEIVVGSIMNHTDPRVSIVVEDLAARSIEQAIDEFLAGYEGFEIEQTKVNLAGEEAVLLDGIPGQDYYRKLFVAHEDSLYQLAIAPYDPNLADTLPQAENLYTVVLNSFRFLPQE
jgi:hypothetical protein